MQHNINKNPYIKCHHLSLSLLETIYKKIIYCIVYLKVSSDLDVCMHVMLSLFGSNVGVVLCACVLLIKLSVCLCVCNNLSLVENTKMLRNTHT